MHEACWSTRVGAPLVRRWLGGIFVIGAGTVVRWYGGTLPVARLESVRAVRGGLMQRKA